MRLDEHYVYARIENACARANICSWNVHGIASAQIGVPLLSHSSPLVHLHKLKAARFNVLAFASRSIFFKSFQAFEKY